MGSSDAYAGTEEPRLLVQRLAKGGDARGLQPDEAAVIVDAAVAVAVGVGMSGGVAVIVTVLGDGNRDGHRFPPRLGCIRRGDS